MNKGLKLLLLCIFLVTGCSTPMHIANQAVDTNLAVEEAHNRILFLNVLRAYKHMPMYFSGFSQFSSSTGFSIPGAGLNVPFGSGAGANTFSTTIETKSIPSATINVYEDEDFIRGITTPVALETVDTYVKDGWPIKFLLALLIKEMTLDTQVYKINPSDTDEGYRKLMEVMSSDSYKLILCANKEKEDTLWSSKAAGIKLGELSEAAAAKLILKEDNGKLSVLKPQKSTLEIRYFKDPTGEVSCDSKGEKKLEANLRSPEATLYFLGQLARCKLEKNKSDASKDKCEVPRLGKDNEELFVVSREKPTNVAVMAEYRGETYYVDGEGWSPTVLSYVTLLVNQHKNVKNFPGIVVGK